MTPSEKDALVNAFYQLRNGDDLISEIATFHDNNFNINISSTPIHFNLPNRPDLDVFLAWHRRQIFEVEQAMQDINPNISIPFWDWTVDRSQNDPLWDNSFMGQFNADWGLGRTFNNNAPINAGYPSHLPRTQDVNSVQSEPNWLTYSNNFERGIVHAAPHIWIGGTMAGGASPLDPVFYLHHGMVDKLWQDWVEANGITSSSNIYQIASLPRYQSVNPDDIVDSRSLGVFFAENQLAQLDNYTVNNTYNSQENFYYQYTIEVGGNFIVPKGKSAKVESVNQIILKPGFHAQNGSTFTAKIDTDNNIIANARTSSGSITRNKKAYNNVIINKNAYQNVSLSDAISVDLFPNPAPNYLRVKINTQFSEGELKIIDLDGKIILSTVLHDPSNEINISQLKTGVYFVKITLNGEHESIMKLAKL